MATLAITTLPCSSSQRARHLDAASAVLDRVVVGGAGVGHAEGDGVHAVAVAAVVVADLVVAAERAGDHQPDAALLENVGDAVALPGLEAGVGGLGEAERAREEEGGLGGVAGVDLEVVDAVDGHRVDGRCVRDLIQGGHLT